MKAYIDRIEGKTAVVLVGAAGEILVPLKALRFKAYEGMHVIFSLKPDPESEAKTRDQILALQKKLLKKSR